MDLSLVHTSKIDSKISGTQIVLNLINDSYTHSVVYDIVLMRLSWIS